MIFVQIDIFFNNSKSKSMGFDIANKMT